MSFPLSAFSIINRGFMERRNNVKIRNAFFATLGDVLAILIAAFISLISIESGFISYATLAWIIVNVGIIVSAFYYSGHYSLVFRIVSVVEILRIVLTLSGALGLNLLFAAITNCKVVCYKTCFVFAICSFALVFLMVLLRKATALIRQKFINRAEGKIHVLIVGAGGAGVQLVKEMVMIEKPKYVPVCIVDDDPKKQGEYVSGIKIAGAISDVKSLCDKYDVHEIFISIPSASKKLLAEIVNKCKSTGRVVKTLPDVSEIANGKVTIESLKSVDVKDLLGRDQVKVDLDQIKEYIKNKVVLVTGGGGSIGSELCRQIATFDPKKLIILDYYENNAYDIEQELLRKHPEINLVTLIANVREKDKIRKVFETYRPQIVFHAAAHKHVPLMETSPNEAVKNNVFGTLNVARAADEFNAETFVQISTDKAVNPTNIMGATKRICEMIIQTIGRHSKNTKFVAVRFGNVLGSNGSVIPLFKKQIEEGGPVTVTHKDVVRYFMTIKEAVSLVLQAGAFAKSGQIFVLDMGEQVKIYDLAVNLIKLSGLEPNVDIDIVCTGLRPGEKLYEERLMEEEGLQKTANGLISIAKPIALDEQKLWAILDRLYIEAYSEADDMKRSVKELVDTYTIDER